jgi:Trk-type K+ transport system membrane component
MYSIYIDVIVADDKHTAQKINNRSLRPFSKDTRTCCIYVFPITRTYLLMLEHSDKNVISLEMLSIPSQRAVALPNGSADSRTV